MHERRLRIHLAGGLGNQLFQIAFARFSIETYPQEISSVLIDPSVSDLKRRDQTNSLRRSLTLRVNETWAPSNPLAGLARSLLTLEFPPVSARHDKGLFKSSMCHETLLVSGQCEHFTSFPSITGFFQSTPEFLSWIQLSRPIHLKNQLETSSTNYASLHLRRGDYDSQRFGLLGPNYYAQSLEQVHEPEVRVFSDNLKAAEQLIRELRDPRLVLVDQDMTNVSLLNQMAGGTSLIAANSTLSWWAGNLGAKKRVRIAPSSWLRSDPTVVLPGAGWVRVACDWI